MRWGRRGWVALVAAVAVVGVLIGMASCTGKNAVDQGGGNFRYVSGTQLGSLISTGDRKPAGSFDADLLSGGTFGTAQFAGKVTVINFWATWCPPCVTETPQFDLVYRANRAKGVVFVGVDTKDDKGKAQAFVRDNDITYPIVFDQTGETALKLGRIPTTALPETVLIDKQGRVAAVYQIRLQAQDVQSAVNKLLAET